MIRAVLFAALLSSAAIAAPSRPEQAAQIQAAALAGNSGYALLEDLTTTVGQRLAGTPAEQRGRDWAKKALADAGFTNIREEFFPLTVWQRGIETAEVTGAAPQKLAVSALGNSGSTPAAGITAPIAYVPDFATLEAAPAGAYAGRIVFIDSAMKPAQDASSYGYFGAARRTGPSVAASKGALATIIRPIGTDNHRNPHTGGTNWRPGQAPAPAASLSNPDADQLVRLLKRGPVSIHLTITTSFDPAGRSGNVSAEIPGTSDEVIVIGGHMDSWDLGTGVLDDAAGIAITMAAAEQIQAYAKTSGIKPRRTIRLVFWGSEEVGIFGGRAYAAAHKDEKIVLAGESDAGADRVWRLNSQVGAAGQPLVAEIALALAPLGIAPSGNNKSSGGGDVAPLVANGVGIIDLEQDATRYFDIHHTPDDTLDKVDKAQFDQNVAAWATAIWLAATDDRPLRTK